ncbi:MAG: phosphoesterase RecJ-like protein [Planctomycetota bacterium]|nr:MAG: phosphoesterase RecJ-like protein [Planctomycetota bacterium]
MPRCALSPNLLGMIEAAAPTADGGAPQAPAPPASLQRIAPATVAATRAIFAAIQQARCVLVTSEPYPDGDAVGAEIALHHIAEHAFRCGAAARGEERPAGRVYLVNEKGCPRKYRFLAGSGRIRTLDSVLERDFDLGIVVDGGVERTGAVQALFEACPRKIYIDHHKFGSRAQYDLVLADPNASSTTQLLWTFVADPEIGVPLGRELAEAIYLGLIYDTGSFQYSLTQPLTHEIAARLIETGLDFAPIHEHALLCQEFEELLVLGQVLAQAQRSPCGRIVWSSASRELIERNHVRGEDLGRIIQTLCFTEGIEVAILFREEGPGRYKLSLRSRGRIDVGAVARALDPHGGGHDRAAGCTLTGPLAEVTARAVGYVRALLDG